MIMMQTGPICVSDGEAQAHLPSPCPASRQVSVITIIMLMTITVAMVIIIPTTQCCHLFSALNHVSVSLPTVHLSQGNIWPALGDFYTYLWSTHCSALWHNSFVFVEHIIWIVFLLLTYFVLWAFFATFISKDYVEKNVWFRQVNVGAAPSGPQLIEQFYKKVEKEKLLHQIHKFSTYTNIID